MLENGYTCFYTHLEKGVSKDIGLSLNFIAQKWGIKKPKGHKSYPFFALK